MSSPQPPYGQQPPAQWTSYPSTVPTQGDPPPHQGGYPPPSSSYPTPGAYPLPPSAAPSPTPPGGYPQQPGGYIAAPYALPSAPPASTQRLLQAGGLAALGGAAALIGFFWAPFYTASNAGVTRSAEGPDFTRLGTLVTTVFNVSYPMLWAVPVVAVVALALGLYLAFGSRTTSPASIRGMASILVVLSLLAAGVLLYVYTNFNSTVQAVVAELSVRNVAESYGFDFGFWLAVAGTVFAAIGGVMAIGKAKR